MSNQKIWCKLSLLFYVSLVSGNILSSVLRYPLNAFLLDNMFQKFVSSSSPTTRNVHDFFFSIQLPTFFHESAQLKIFKNPDFLKLITELNVLIVEYLLIFHWIFLNGCITLCLGWSWSAIRIDCMQHMILPLMNPCGIPCLQNWLWCRAESHVGNSCWGFRHAHWNCCEHRKSRTVNF